MKKTLPLTELEKKVWGFVLGFYADNDYAPTRTEIGEFLGYKKFPAQMAESLVQNMVHKGYFKLGDGWRNIIIIKQQ